MTEEQDPGRADLRAKKGGSLKPAIFKTKKGAPRSRPKVRSFTSIGCLLDRKSADCIFNY